MLKYLKEIYFNEFDIKKAIEDYKEKENYVNSYDSDYTPAGVAFNSTFTDGPRQLAIDIARTVKFIENDDKVKFDIKFRIMHCLDVVHDYEYEKLVEYFKTILSEDEAIRFFHNILKENK